MLFVLLLGMLMYVLEFVLDLGNELGEDVTVGGLRLHLLTEDGEQMLEDPILYKTIILKQILYHLQDYIIIHSTTILFAYSIIYHASSTFIWDYSTLATVERP